MLRVFILRGKKRGKTIFKLTSGIPFLVNYLGSTKCILRASLAPQMVKNLPAMQETWIRSLGSGRSPGERHGYTLQYSHLENSMDRGAWQATVHGVTKSQTLLSNYHTHTQACFLRHGEACSLQYVVVKIRKGSDRFWGWAAGVGSNTTAL